MSVPAAYAAVVTIWSLTPLAIVWSTETMSPIASVWLRMSTAAVLGLVLLRVARIPLPWHKQAIKVYACSVLGVFFGMMLTYIAARHIPSGVISVTFALTPVVSGVLAHLLLNDRTLTPIRWIAFAVALSGMAMIFLREQQSAESFEGMVMVLTAMFVLSLSGVLVKKTATQMHFLSVSVGGVFCSVPCYTVAWLLLDGQAPVLDWSTISPWATLFLAVFGSLLGFACFYYILQRLAPTSVTLITLMTPVMALFLGAQLNDEQLGPRVYLGTVLVLGGLAIYLWGHLLIYRLRGRYLETSST